MSGDACFNIAIASTFIIGLIVAVGIIGNCLAFVVFWKGNFKFELWKGDLKSPTSFLFMSLALIDSAVLLTFFTYHTAVVDFYIDWIPRELRVYLSVCAYPLYSMAATATIWVTALMTINRYIIMCLPLRASQCCTLSKVKKQLAVVLLLVVLYNIPEIARYRVVHITWNNGTSYVAVTELMGPHSFPQFYKVYDNVLRAIVLRCLPLFIVTLSTTRLIITLYAHRHMQVELQSVHSKQERVVTLALVIVATVFIVSRVPGLVLLVANLVGSSEWALGFWCYMTLIHNTFVALNSSAKFFVYVVINKRFSDVFVENVCRRHTVKPVVTVNMMTMSVMGKRETGDVVDTQV